MGASKLSGGGRLRLELPDVAVYETPASPLSGVGLQLSGGKLDAQDVEDLRDELNRWLEERGRA